MKFPTEGNVHDRAKFPALVRKFGSIVHIFFSRKFLFVSCVMRFQIEHRKFPQYINWELWRLKVATQKFLPKKKLQDILKLNTRYETCSSF